MTAATVNALLFTEKLTVLTHQRADESLRTYMLVKRLHRMSVAPYLVFARLQSSLCPVLLSKTCPFALRYCAKSSSAQEERLAAKS